MIKIWHNFRFLTSVALVTIFTSQPIFAEQIHIVSPADLRQETINIVKAREAKIHIVTSFLFTPQSEKAMQSTHFDPTRVKNAISLLSDEELAQLSSRAEKAQVDFAAGRLSDRDLLWVVVGIAALVLIIVAVR